MNSKGLKKKNLNLKHRELYPDSNMHSFIDYYDLNLPINEVKESRANKNSQVSNTPNNKKKNQSTKKNLME